MGSTQRRSSSGGVAAESAAEVATSSSGGNALNAASYLTSDGSESDDALQSLMSLPEEPAALAGPDTEDRALALARSSRSEELVRHVTTPGEGTAALASMMRRLQSAPSAEDARADLEALAVLRGDPDTTAITEQYERFLRMRSADLLRDGEFEALDEENHPTFMASPEQMAYGRVVGDVLGMDPVLASLLNPTGGLVGPGNMAVERPRDSSIGTHGIVHDAMGYLTNHGYGGPGYDYLGDDAAAPYLGAGNPLTGQESGTGFWSGYDGTSSTEEGGGAVVGIGLEYGEAGARRVGQEVGAGVARVERGVKTGARIAGHAVAAGKGLATEAVGDARQIGGRAVELGGQVVGGAIDDVTTIGHHAIDAASNLGGQAWDTGSTLLGNAATAVGNVGSHAWDAAGDLASNTVDSASGVASQGLEAAGNAANQALDGDLGGAAETAWDGWVGVVHGARDTVGNAASGAMGIASDAAHGLIAADRDLVHGAYDAAVDLGGQAWDAGSGLVGEAIDADRRLVHGAIDGARELGGAAWDAGGTLVDHAGEAAHGVADEVAQGLGFPDVESAGSWAAEQATNWFGGGDEEDE